MNGTDLAVKSVELDLTSTDFGTGFFTWHLFGEDINLKPHKGSTWKTDVVSGSKVIMLTAMMSGGKSSTSRHAQLFTAHTRNAEEGVKFKMIMKLQSKSIFCKYNLWKSIARSN